VVLEKVSLFVRKFVRMGKLWKALMVREVLHKSTNLNLRGPGRWEGGIGKVSVGLLIRLACSKQKIQFFQHEMTDNFNLIVVSYIHSIDIGSFFFFDIFF